MLQYHPLQQSKLCRMRIWKRARHEAKCSATARAAQHAGCAPNRRHCIRAMICRAVPCAQEGGAGDNNEIDLDKEAETDAGHKKAKRQRFERYEDDFIDDSEIEKVKGGPKVKTQHSGFYVNIVSGTNTSSRSKTAGVLARLPNVPRKGRLSAQRVHCFCLSGSIYALLKNLQDLRAARCMDCVESSGGQLVDRAALTVLVVVTWCVCCCRVHWP